MEITSPTEAELQPLSFTPDQKDGIKSKVKKIQQDLAMIPWLLDRDELSGFHAHSVMSITEHAIAQLGKCLDVKTESNDKIEKRHAEIRAANMRIRELEALLGQGMPPQAIQPALKNMCDKLNGWWDLEGFGYISDITFGEYTLRATFSCQFLSIRPYIENTEHLSHKERMVLWLEAQQQRGFVLLTDDGDKGIRDCPESRDALRYLFSSRLPSSNISCFSSRESKKGSHLTSVEVYIRNIAELLDLPVRPAGQED